MMVAMLVDIVNVSLFMWHSSAYVEDGSLGLCSLTASLRANTIFVGFFFLFPSKRKGDLEDFICKVSKQFSQPL